MTFQMSAGSLIKPEQFVIVDDNTVRVDFAKNDRLTIPDLAVIVPCVVNSELVKKNASGKARWGLERGIVTWDRTNRRAGSLRMRAGRSAGRLYQGPADGDSASAHVRPAVMFCAGGQ
jgi:hypothetical protein